MKDKIVVACAVIVAICFVSIAISQHNRAKAEKILAESYAVLAASEILNIKTSTKIAYLEPHYSEAKKLGWSLESSFLYAIGSKHANPEIYKEIQEERETVTKEKAAKQKELDSCIKSKLTSPDPTEGEEALAWMECYK